ncbi:MAG: hypothetical protein GC154_15050 [bacterium]|nr:hypothetical protein [bacterium]
MALLADRLEQFLMPLIGERLAHRLMLAYCAHQNKQMAEISSDDLPMLGQFLSENLQIFVGADQAQLVLKALSGNKK